MGLFSPVLLEQASIAAEVSSALQPITSIGTGAESLFESMSCYVNDSFSGLCCRQNALSLKETVSNSVVQCVIRNWSSVGASLGMVLVWNPYVIYR